MGYDRIRPSLDIESNLKSGIVRGGRSIWHELEIGVYHQLEPAVGRQRGFKKKLLINRVNSSYFLSINYALLLAFSPIEFCLGRYIP